MYCPGLAGVAQLVQYREEESRKILFIKMFT